MKRFIMTLCACGIALALNPAFAQETQASTDSAKPILGMVVIGKTTLSEFAKELEAKHCKFNKSPKAIKDAYVRVDEDCFDLPGSPRIQAEAKGGLDQPIVQLTLESSFEIAAPYDFYLKVLEQSHGKPTIVIDTLTRKAALWRLPDQSVIAIAARAGEGRHELQIMYTSGEMAKKIWELFSVEGNPQPTKDTALL
ncbi:MAG: hypothetical protein LUC43_03945 [Burkholderiales bacterium]|nr:hypothetical protein [Burkholderiales bacterium]